MNKNIFIFDQNKCVGCHACVVACINENGIQKNDQWRNIHKSQDGLFPDLPLIYLSQLVHTFFVLLPSISP